MFALVCALVQAAVPPYSCQKGLFWIRYYNEISFNDVAEQYYVDTVHRDSFNYGYNAISVIGSFCPNVSGTYSIRLETRPCGQLIWGSYRLPNEIGAAGNCWWATNTVEQLDNQKLDAHHCYPFRINLRTGCTLYAQYMRLLMKRDDGDWYYPDQEMYISCGESSWIDQCDSEYFGADCSQKCNSSCISEHGWCFNGTSGNGQCICEDGWKKPDCSVKNDDLIPPPGVIAGADYAVYRNEVSFTDLFEEHTVDTLNHPGIGYVFMSVAMRGAIMPEYDGEYQFRIYGKPHAQVVFEGDSVPAVIGPAACCNDNEVTDLTTNVYHLRKHATYPFGVYYRSGCGVIWRKKLILQWKNGPKYGGVENAPWEDIPSILLYQTGERDCIDGYWGEDCTGKCKECPSNMICDKGFGGTGECVCPPMSDDCFCSKDSDCNGHGTCSNGTCICDPQYHGDNCERYCDDFKTCHGHGTCDPNGYCYCQKEWFGETCDLKCTREAACHGHGECKEGGVCECDEGYTGNTCARRPYQPSPGESAQGGVYTLYNNEFFGGGTEVQDEPIDTPWMDMNHWTYRSLDMHASIVTEDKMKVKLRVNAHPFAQIHANLQTLPGELGPAGSCLAGMQTTVETDEFVVNPNKFYPFQLWFRSGCSLFPQHMHMQWKTSKNNKWENIPKENLRAVSADVKCLERYSGLLCDDYCDANCSMNGECVLENGVSKCKCFDHYYGEHCEKKCDPAVDCNGHGRCDNDKCVCDIYHSGEHCEIGCSRETTCNNHGTCTDQGTCQCDAGFEGETCAQHTYQPSANETVKGVLFTEYETEAFLKEVSHETINNVSLSFTTLSWKGMKLTGAFFVNNRKTVNLRINAKPYAQLTILGKSYPPTLGPSMSCWGSTVTVAETGEIDLIPNKLYPFTVSYRSGCSFIQQYLKLEWQAGESETWEPIGTYNLRTPKEGQTCMDRYFGENCDEYCDADCNLHGDCVLEGGQSVCKCYSGYSGEHCENGNGVTLRNSVQRNGPSPVTIASSVIAVCVVCVAIVVVVILKRRNSADDAVASTRPLLTQ